MIYVSSVLLLFSSPCMGNRSANLRVVSRYIAWGKDANLDYILCEKSLIDDLHM